MELIQAYTSARSGRDRKKQLEKVTNGVEEGRQIEAGSATKQSDKVVRLPRDWLGPREYLVPLGESTPSSSGSGLDGLAPDDFWGERAADIHSALQAPDGEASYDPPASESAPKVRVALRLLSAGALMGIAAAAALALLLGGSPKGDTGGPRLNVGAIFRTEVARILKAGAPHIVAHTASPPPVRHARHHIARPKPAPAQAEHRSSPPPASAYVPRVPALSPEPTYHLTVTSPTPRAERSARRLTSASANARPTGQAGALGPVSSPNG